MTSFADVRALEERAINAWPALERATEGGWLFRAAGGCTKRANSANAITPSLPIETIRAAAERFYADRQLPTVFRLSPLAPDDADAALAAAGYRLLDPSIVMTAPIASDSEPAPAEIAAAPSSAWLGGIARANGVAERLRPMHDAIVRAIALPAAFATLSVEGRPVAFGLAVHERGMVGLFDIVVAPEQRRRGHGRAMTRTLLHWGRQVGARTAYLQVRGDNAAALGLYARLGFSEAYRYHYRMAAD